MQIYTAMKRIVHKEQSQRGIHLVEGFCARIMEPASEPRAIEVRRFSCVIGRRANSVQAFGHSVN